MGSSVYLYVASFQVQLQLLSHTSLALPGVWWANLSPELEIITAQHTAVRTERTIINPTHDSFEAMPGGICLFSQADAKWDGQDLRQPGPLVEKCTSMRIDDCCPKFVLANEKWRCILFSICRILLFSLATRSITLTNDLMFFFEFSMKPAGIKSFAWAAFALAPRMTFLTCCGKNKSAAFEATQWIPFFPFKQ